jgi:MOSC domain-containing protein YiiM
VTLVSKDQWAAVVAALGRPVDPSVRRANLLVSGIELEARRGEVLLVGACRLKVQGETRPCERMDEALQGLRAALERARAGGIYAEVLEGGVVGIGDPVRWEA